MTRYRLLLLAMMMLGALTLAAPALAQDESPGSDWIAWLYESSFGVITLVNQDGTVVRELPLPLAQAFDSHGHSILVSPSGSHVAFIAIDSSASIPNRQLFVYNTALNNIGATYPLDPQVEATALDLSPAPAGLFNEEARHLVFSYILFDENNVSSWEIVILDYVTGQEIAIITAGEAAQQEPLLEDLVEFVMPYVQRYQDGEVTFATVYYATEAFPEYPAFTWDLASGAVEYAGEQALRISPPTAAGQYVRAALDADRPYADPAETFGLPLSPLNVVRVTEADGSFRDLHHEPERHVSSAYFVQNDERVMAQIYDAADNETVWKLIDLNGEVLAEFDAIPMSVDRVHSTPDGFAYLRYDQPPALIYVDTRAGVFEETILWTGEGDFTHNLVTIQSEPLPGGGN
jgi:hypothetical protein